MQKIKLLFLNKWDQVLMIPSREINSFKRLLHLIQPKYLSEVDNNDLFLNKMPYNFKVS
jgi:hypothetical protein